MTIATIDLEHQDAIPVGKRMEELKDMFDLKGERRTHDYLVFTIRPVSSSFFSRNTTAFTLETVQDLKNMGLPLVTMYGPDVLCLIEEEPVDGIGCICDTCLTNSTNMVLLKNNDFVCDSCVAKHSIPDEAILF